MKHFLRILFISVFTSVVLGSGWLFVSAQQNFSGPEAVIEDEAAVGKINDLNEEIAEKRSSVENLRKDISTYRSRIEAKRQEAATLQDELELLSNRVTQTELELQAIEAEREAVNAEIRVLDLRIGALDKQLDMHRESLAAILTKLDTYDNDMTLQLLFGNDSFAELFDRLETLQNMTGDLHEVLLRARSEKQQVTLARAEREAKKMNLDELESNRQTNRQQLASQQAATTVLLDESQQSETEFRQLLADLREEEASINFDIVKLQDKIESTLDEQDTLGGSSVLSWPIDPKKGISATFHDRDYPFRNLFEHSGIDLPTPLGTSVRAAAPGYVAWTRTGRMYGNYIMILHTNGVATLYAHLSKMSVSAEQFVSRGDIIGSSGGVPGTPGAGLSTGAHLHFEVRKDGVPVNPLGYLIDHDL